jgi:hypothetical protein
MHKAPFKRSLSIRRWISSMLNSNESDKSGHSSSTASLIKSNTGKVFTRKSYMDPSYVRLRTHLSSTPVVFMAFLNLIRTPPLLLSISGVLLS